MKTFNNIGLILLMTAVVFTSSAQNTLKTQTFNSTCKVQHDVALLKAEVITKDVEAIVLNSIKDLDETTITVDVTASKNVYTFNIFKNKHIKKGFFFLNDFFENAPAEAEMKNNTYADGSFDFMGERFEDMPEEKAAEPEGKTFKFLGEEYPEMPEEQIIL